MKIEEAAQAARERINSIIQAAYPGKVEENTERLCKNCLSWDPGCHFYLIPVTHTGGDCPYFNDTPPG